MWEALHSHCLSTLRSQDYPLRIAQGQIRP